MGTKDNATQLGAEPDNDTVVEPTPNLNPRAAAMDAIADKVDIAMREELGLPNEDDEEGGNVTTPDPDKDPDEKPEERKVIKPAEDVAPDKPYRKMVDGEVRWVTKVDGEERIADDDEIIRGYQKNQTASKRLEEAARRQKELDALEETLRAEEARIAALREEQIKKIQTPLSEPQGSEKVAAVDDADYDELLNAIYEGNNAKAKQLLAKLQFAGHAGTPATPQPTVDLDGIADRAAAKAAEQIAMKTAMEKFQKDYKDIISNPHLAKVADGFLDEELRNKPFADALEEAGKRTREWIAEITPKPDTKDTPPVREHARANKEKVDNLPSQSSVSSPANDDVEESPSDIIRSLRKARGLPV